MNRISCGLIFLLSITSAHAADGDWPKLVGGAHASECRAAFHLAHTAFRSNDFWPGAQRAMPRHFGYQLVSRRNASWKPLIDLDVFTKSPLPAEMSSHNLYWQTRAGPGQRLVIEEIPSGMHDTYELVAIDAAMDKATYFAGRKQETTKPLLPPLFYSMINVPAVFQKSGSTELWAMNEGYLSEPVPNWTVYAARRNRYQETCKIRFGPEGKRPLRLLPAPVQGLAALLHRAVAPINLNREGTPPAVAYDTIWQTWANAALRPWVGPGQPDVSRRRSDKDLKQWMVKKRDQRKAYQAVVAQLPLAELALAEHYQTTFNMSESGAAAAARTWIDRAYLAYADFAQARDPGE